MKLPDSQYNQLKKGTQEDVCSIQFPNSDVTDDEPENDQGQPLLDMQIYKTKRKD